jgi:hypothetical protein
VAAFFLTLVLVFPSVYNLGDVQGGVGIHHFMHFQQYVLLAAVPLGLALVLGFVMRVWDAKTGELRWSKTFAGAGARTCVRREGVLVSPSEVGVTPDEVIFLDIRTGEPRWKHKEEGIRIERLFFLGDARVIVTAGDTTSVKTLRIADGSVAFSLSGLSRYDIYGIQDGDLIIRFVRDGVAEVVRANPETGEQAPYGSGHLAGLWELSTQRYLLTRIEGWPEEERTSHHLFKAEG